MFAKTLLLAICVLTRTDLLAAANDETKKDETVLEQRKLAEETWKKILPRKPVTFTESDNFLLYGTVEEKELENLAKAMEKAFNQVKKTAQITPKDELWPGKLVVFVFAERGELTTFARNADKRNLERDEAGAFKHGREYTSITVGPAGGSKTGALDVELVRHLGAAVISKKSTKLPDWFIDGFGRSAAYRYAPAQFQQERAKARDLVLKQGKTAKDIWGGKLAADEGAVLHASFVDYLANGPQIAKLFPELVSFIGADTTFEDTLKAVKLTPDQVDLLWRKWVQSAK